MSAEMELADDLADVLAHQAAGWLGILDEINATDMVLNAGLRLHSEVNRVMRRWREAKDNETPGNFGPLYQQGHASVDLESLAQSIDARTANLLDCRFGVQVNHDGRVWVCINGVTWLRFKPSADQQQDDHDDEDDQDDATTDVHTVRE